MLIYPMELELDANDTLLATFPDVPGAVTYGSDGAEAQMYAVGALVTIFSA